MLLKYLPKHTHIRFIKLRWLGFLVSLMLLIASGFLLATKGLNYGIDFTGGILMEIRTDDEADIAALRAVLNQPSLGEVSLQNFGTPRDVLIRAEVIEGSEQAEMVEEMKVMLTTYDRTIQFRKVDFVGPTIGDELIESGITALVVAFVAVLLYVWFRFEWQFGLGAILALAHDAVIILGFYAVSGFEVGMTSIAAVLTVIGYSINDSVVIYDRIRENMRKYKKMPLNELLDRSINDTLSRTVITALTTMLAAAALVWFGGEVLKGFSAALLVGVLVGTYSSIYVAAPVLIYFGLRPGALEKAACSTEEKRPA